MSSCRSQRFFVIFMFLVVLVSFSPILPAVYLFSSEGQFMVPSVRGSPDEPWSHTYVPALDWNFTTVDVVKVNASTYAMAGTVENTTGTYPWLLLTNQNGAAHWNRTYGDGTRYANSLIRSRMGGFLIGGDPTYRLYSNGEINWTVPLPGVAEPLGSAIETNQGHFAGTFTGVDASGFSDFGVGEINAYGNIVGYYQWGDPNQAELATCIIECSGGGFAIVGNSHLGGTTNPNDIWLLRTSIGWVHLWNKTFGGSTEDSADGGILECSAGGFAICGQLSGEVALIRTSDTGVQQWSKTYDDGVGKAFVECSGGGFAIIAEMSDGLSLLRTDANGNLLWTRNIHSSAKSSSIFEISSGGFIIGGSVSYSETGYHAPWLMWVPDEAPPSFPLLFFILINGGVIIGIVIVILVIILLRRRQIK